MFLTATRTKKYIIKQLIIMLMHLIYDYAHAHDFVPDCFKTQDCVIKLSTLILLQYNLFLNTIILMKSVIKLLILVLYLTLFLIDISLKKCLTEFFLKIILCYNIVPIGIRPKKCVVKLLIVVFQH